MKKLNNKGFTLTELLCVIVIVILLTACITVGIGTGSKAFGKTFGFSKAQMLSSSLNYLIADELRTAHYEGQSENGNVTYTGGNYVKSAVATMKVRDDGRVIVKTDDEKDEYNKAGNVYELGTSKLYGSGLSVNSSNFTIQKNGDHFDVSYEILNSSGKPLTHRHFQVKCISD